ncbi:MAG TPA: NAD(P)H-binding protein [Thermoleophilaceae bacterium]|nr:NAD(P)H-binding protein [Thermoleophilaceae bacterium]
MILLTGASGAVGSALLRRLLAAGRPVRCLVRDPRELGAERVRVGLVLGDLADPTSTRHAMRGVDCVVHLAAAIRDGQRASIEELNALATVRLVRAAEHASISRFLFLSTLGVSQHARSRYLRSRALAEDAVARSPLETTILAPSLVVAARARLMTLIERLAWLPAVPVYGRGDALWEPIAAADVADCAIAALDEPAPGRFELAGPDRVSYDELTAAVLRARGRRRRRVHLPPAAVRAALAGLERTLGPSAPATRDEADLLEVSMTTERGTADAERLRVRPQPLAHALVSSRSGPP